MFRTTATSFAARAAVCTRSSRGFHASPVAQKTMKEKVAEVADKVNKGVGKGLASALDKGEKAAKETLSSVSGDKAEAEGVVKRAGKEAAAAGKKAKADVEKEL